MKFVVKRRLGSVVPKVGLVVALLLSGFGVFYAHQSQVSAFEGSGAGKFGDPYLITNCVELQSIQDTLDNSFGGYVYKLANNIDCSDSVNWNGGQGFDPIGEPFPGFALHGTFDGGGYTISNLYINRPEESHVGLFGQTSSLVVGGLTLEDAQVVGGDNTGALIGYAAHTIFKSVKVSGSVAGQMNVGGVAGYIQNAYGRSQLSMVGFEGEISAGSHVGGVAGYVSASTIENVYAQADISFSSEEGSYGGGLFGITIADRISNAYATGGFNKPITVWGGGLFADLSNTPVVEHAFANFAIDAAETNYGNIGAVAGKVSGLVFTDVHFNSSVVNNLPCSQSEGETVSCQSIDLEATPNYLFNRTNAPLSSWNDQSWVFNSGTYPVTVAPVSLPTLAVIDDVSVNESGLVTINTAPGGTNLYPVNWYRVVVYKVGANGLERVSENRTYTPADTSVQALGVEPGSNYELHIDTMTRFGDSIPGVVNFSPESPSFPAVTNLSAVATGSSATISLQHADTGTPGVIVYGVEYKVHGQDWSTAKKTTASPFESSFTISGLTAGLTYDLRIKGMSQYGTDPHTNPANNGPWGELTFTVGDYMTKNVATCQQLADLNSDPVAAQARIVLTNDIDCASIGNFAPLGGQDSDWLNYFGGLFEGNGKAVRNLVISSDNNAGLFARTNGAIIQNVRFEGGSVTGDDTHAGSVAGRATNTVLKNIHTDIDVRATGWNYAGGIVGSYDLEGGALELSQLSSSRTVLAEETSGGLIGQLGAESDAALTIRNSSVTGAVSAVSEDDSTYRYAGGLVGGLELDDRAQVRIIDSYVSADIEGDRKAGGLIGDGQLNDDTELIIDRTYTSGDVTSEVAGGFIAAIDIADATAVLDVRNSLSAGIITGSDASGLIGELSVEGETPAQYDLTNTHYLSDVAIECISFVETPGCQAYPQSFTGQFTGTTARAPFDTWNFRSVWQVNAGALPTLLDTEDLDAAPVEVELSAPNNGDANYDGVLDALQPHVTSVVNLLTGKYVTVAVAETCRVAELGIVEQSTYTSKDTAYAYPGGFVEFELDCGESGFTTPVEIYYRGVADDGLVVRKHNPSTGAYFNLASYGATLQKEIRGDDSFFKIAYEVTDGGILDVDGVANGRIIDPVGLARQTVGVPNTGFSSRR